VGSLREGRTRRRIGVITPLAGGYFFGDILVGAQAVASQRDCQLVAIQTANPWPRPEVGHADVTGWVPYAWDHVDGSIVVIDAVAPSVLASLIASGKPLVTIARQHPDAGGISVHSDNAGGTAAAVAHLYEHGHRKIAFAGCFDQEDIIGRFDGYRSALERHGLEFDPDLVLRLTDNLAPGGRHAAERLLEMGLPCTAVVTGTDHNAISMMEVLQAAGVRIPQDLAVVGFDDCEMAQRAVPALTTVRQRFDSLGSIAVDAVLDIVEGRAMQAGVRLSPTLLVCRHSCGCEEGAADEPSAIDFATDDWRQTLAGALATRLVSPLQPAPGTPPNQVWAGVDVLVDGLAAVLRDEPGPPANELDMAWQAAANHTRVAETMTALIGLLQTAGAAQASALGVGADVEHRLEQFVDQNRLEVLRSCALARQTDAHLLEAASHISRTFLKSSSEERAQLAWMPILGAVQGCVALWQDEASSPEPNPGLLLRLTQTYYADPTRSLGAVEPMTPAAFPPESWLDSADANGELAPISICSLGSADRDWGALAACLPADDRFFGGYEMLRHAAVELTLALEHDLLLHERTLTELRVQQQERYFRALVEQSSDFVLVVDATGAIRYASPSHERLLGISPTEMEGTMASEWMEGSGARLLRAAVERAVEAVEPVEIGELRISRSDGAARVLHMVATNRLTDPAVDGVILNSYDITSRKTMEEVLERQAMTDALTALPNRRLLYERAGQAISLAHRDGSGLALLMMDLDGFKAVNDVYGHSVGDKLLREVADRLRAVTRDADTIARLGGDEFAILLRGGTGQEGAISVCDRILRSFDPPAHLEGVDVPIRGSIGVALYPEHGMDVESILRAADQAMYQAKHSSSHFVVFVDHVAPAA
jgi:diguanylate cyclase (GGDEF)-like protein/PAS domain S-box-containing protein